jgi:hypothetical protein
MDNTIIIILGLILIFLVLLNHVTIVTTTSKTIEKQSNCSQTAFGCCPDGVNSKINYFGSNCPGYRPGPGYYPNPGPGPKPIGGCAGTRFGCCPNNNNLAKYDERGSNCLV